MMMRSGFLFMSSIFFLATPAQAEWQPGYRYGGFNDGGPRTAVEYDGWLAIGGSFSGADGVRARGVIFYDLEDFTAPGGVAELWAPGEPGAVNALSVHDGDLVAAGEFSSDGPTASWTNIARFDGSAWRPLGAGADLLGGRVDALESFDGELVAIGTFTQSGDGTMLEGAASWNGTAWQPMGIRPKGARAIAVYGGELWCGFSRWDGAQWQPVATFGPEGREVTAMGVLQRGLAIGGTFETVDGQDRVGSALVTEDGLSGFLTLCEYVDPGFLPDCSPLGVGGFAVWRGKDWVLSPQSRVPQVEGAFLFGSAPGEEWTVHPGVPFTGGSVSRGAEIVVYRDELMVLMDGPGRLSVAGAVQRNAFVLDDAGARPLVRGNGVRYPAHCVERIGAATILGQWDSSVTFHGDEGNSATLQAGESIGDFVSTPWGSTRLSQFDFVSGHVGGSLAIAIETDATGGTDTWREPQHPLGLDRWGPATSWHGLVLAALQTKTLTGWALGSFRSVEDPAYVDEQIQWLNLLDEEPVGLHAHENALYLLKSGGRTLWRGHQSAPADPTSPFDFVQVAEFDEPVTALASHQGQLVAAGRFSNVNGVQADGLAFLGPAGWTAPHQISGEVLTLEADPVLGALWVGGTIDAIDGQPTSHLFVIVGDEVGAFTEGPDGVVRDIAVTEDGILVAGDFDHAGGLPSDNLAEWIGDPRTVRIGPGESGPPPTPRATRAVLHAPRPNPFNPRVILSFTLPDARAVELTVFDLKGRRVRTLLSERREAGPHEVIWDGTGARGRPVASGTYLAVLTAEGERDAQKLTLVR